jgi:spore coat polysaccharide biosynthesis protein SpsF (cytidylyltransferase family)
VNIGIIIQIRTGSTRLPNKVLLPFYGNDLLIDVLLKKFFKLKSTYPVIVATTTNSKDDIICDYALKHHLTVFRGSEDDVLKRFIDAADFHKIDTIIRVCGDNPFLSIEFIENLIKEFQKNDNFDYVSYRNKMGIPTIRTHYGFFAELVKLSTLKKVIEQTEETLYHEHVTNYIYNYKQKFKIHLLDIPFEENEKVRLTVDTLDDFNLTKEIYRHFMETEEMLSPENIMQYVTQNQAYLDIMNKQIQQQTK